MATFVEIVLFPRPIRHMTEERGGLVDGACYSAAVAVRDKGSTLVGDRYTGHHGSQHLKDAGSVVPNGKDIDGPSWSVQFVHPAAKIHHQGARRHHIPNIPGGGFLYRDGPGVVTSTGDSTFGPRPKLFGVEHPGTTGNPYLVNAARSHGLTVAAPSFRVRQSVEASIGGSVLRRFL